MLSQKTTSRIVSATLAVWFLFGIFGSVFALSEPVQCCKLRHDIKIDNEMVHKGDVAAAEGVTLGSDACPIDTGNINNQKNWASYCSLDAFLTVADLVRVIAWILTGVVVLAAGVMYATAGDSSQKIEKSKKLLQSAIIGILIIVMSKFIASLGRFFLGV